MSIVPIDQVDEQAWHEKRRRVSFNGREDLFIQLIEELVENAPLKGDKYQRSMRRYVRQGLPWLSKSQVITAYEELCDLDLMEYRPEVVTALQKKPTRSQAGVTVVTVLTKPYPCPGKCIFCPTDVRMPKSYLHDEPGAMRAERHAFDPYAQTQARIEALENIGHPADKIELLILGGTWSSYRRDYQEWFVKRCLDAMNGAEAGSLAEAQALNARGERRNVGLVVETRPDHVDEDELRWFRHLGVTKVQIGVQSLDDRILELNRRGETVVEVRDAVRLLRLAGFKIHVHWMPNLLGATPQSDIEDFGRLWSDPALRPDELKIYPCMLLENAELYEYWQRGKYRPYSDEEILEVLVACKQQVPRYVRINRIIRDIPTTNVVAGISKANLRQIAQQRMEERGLFCQCIRCREIRRETLRPEELQLRVDTYETDATSEHFLSFERDDGRIAAFLRLSHPRPDRPHPFPQLAGQAMIREVHVYGPAVPIGEDSQGEAQHIGLGEQLIERAKTMSREAGYGRIAVISAIGTRGYYARHNFELDDLYMTAPL
ncbi:MAG TPA: tRNA uridine(34) 5-carboxymethylaminomethyl modification radical SAM/GNAT enzyme Elp3 [Candidatus Sulfomarinibacteraceae bacterium]|nr:tRNA uridine(34) 5-carboxymethylaminomethyl modification radical SAM/GNAT enzyme Elp3 [Candidatus Sulfomarinibacteraceae bacterium]